MIQANGDELIISISGAKFYLKRFSNILVLYRKEGKLSCLQPECTGEMYPHKVLTVHRAYYGTALDIDFKCNKCSLYVLRGFAIDNEYKYLNFTNKWVEVQVDKEIKERLRKLGYW